jgi:hypothetical protein
VITSATHNFVAADVGNLIQITAGTNWTTGFYQIVSVAANAATLDRAVGTAVSLTNGTFAVGGALLTIQGFGDNDRDRHADLCEGRHVFNRLRVVDVRRH